MKITINDDRYFKCLNDIFPDPTLMGRRLTALLNRDLDIKSLFDKILKPANNTSYITFFMDYVVRSGNKKISNLIRTCNTIYGLEKIEDYYTSTIDTLNITVQIMKTKYIKKWTKLYNTYELEYNPIKPYDMTIEENGVESLESTANINQNKSKTSNTNIDDKTSEETTNNNSATLTDNVVENSSSSFDEELQTDKSKDITKDGVYGFNSITPVPTNESASEMFENKNNSGNTSGNNSSNRNSSTSEQNSRTNDTTKTFTQDDTTTEQNGTATNYERSSPYEKNISRLGNIGNTSMQELIEQERQVWEYQVIDVIYKDLDSIFVRSKYI